MHEAAIIKKFRRRLVEMGCPPGKLEKTVREFADHYVDLKQAALEEGLSEQDAEARAETRLGDSILLAEQSVAVLSRSSWWGRHPVVGFCVLPIFALAPAWAICGGLLVGICWLLGRIFGPAYTLDKQAAEALASDPNVFHSLATPINGVLMFSATMLITLAFLWLSHRAALSLKWKLIPCAVCSLSILVTHANIDRGSVFVGYGSQSPNWICLAVPLMAAAFAFRRQRSMENCLPPVPVDQSTRKLP